MDAAQTFISGLYNLAKGEDPEDPTNETQSHFDWKAIFRSPPNTSLDSDFTADDNLLFSGLDFYGEGAAFASQAQITNSPPLSPMPKNISLPFFKKEVPSPPNHFKTRPPLEQPIVKLSGRTCSSIVLEQALANQINTFLPPILRLSKSWKLLYSTDQHGLSLTTLYRNVRQKGPCVLAIRDTEEQVFGAFLSDPPEPSPSYYGTGECFLWRETKSRFDSEDSHISLYPWSGQNHYTILCEPDYISVGGGDGKYGLWLDSELDNGLSQTCLTFNNKPLAGPQESFQCLEIELWGFSL